MICPRCGEREAEQMHFMNYSKTGEFQGTGTGHACLECFHAHYDEMKRRRESHDNDRD